MICCCQKWTVNSKYFSVAGADLIDWMMEHIEGFTDRKQARFFANELLNEKLITHFTSVNHFTEKRYYTFGSLIGL